MRRYAMHINGYDHVPQSGEWFETENPFTGEVWAEIARGGAEDATLAVDAAHAALSDSEWSRLVPTQRGHVMRAIGDAIAANASRLAELEVRDNGKLFAEMSGQLNYIPEWFHYYGGMCDKVEGAVIPMDKKGYFTFTRKEPVGVVAIITPWNSPLMLLAWKLAPALAAGCTAVVKPSEFTSVSTLELVKVMEAAGLPPGVVNVVTGFGTEVGSPLIDDRRVRKVGFTGSDATGRHIGAQAARGLKRFTLELGGKSPNIVFDDANLDDAVNGVVAGIFAATGQTCIAGSRLLVQRTIHDEVVARVVELSKQARMGDPMSAETQVGPITTRPQLAKVLEYIDIATEEGATIVLGGERATRAECGTGWFVEPTIVTGVDNAMRIAQEEVFGPVLAVIPFDDEADAVRIANDTRFGLGAGVWTNDLERAFRMSAAIESGTVWVNTYRAVSFLAPFGGVKDSGIGRENGRDAMEEYLETKTVWINTGAATGNPFVMR